MLANKHCELITLSDSDGEQPPMVVTQQQEHRHPQRQNGLQKSECYGGCQSSLVPTSNSAAIPIGHLLFQQQLHQHQQPQQVQRQTLAELLRADNCSSTSNDGTKMCGIQPQKQRFGQPTNGGVTMGIMEEHLLDMTALLNSNRNHPLAQPSTKNSTPTVKEQLIMYFQKQHKMEMQLQHEGTTSESGGSKENGGIFRPLSNRDNIGEDAASKRHKAPEWHPQFNIALLATSVHEWKQMPHGIRVRFTVHPTRQKTMARRPNMVMAAYVRTDPPLNLLLKKRAVPSACRVSKTQSRYSSFVLINSRCQNMIPQTISMLFRSDERAGYSKKADAP
ncbi:hypothetical protein niasHT_026638 [Heterodera trifolii]|uniref:Uncharacterized protein n=1 Tax=Heterodera trifolii TaxID=157864 RepID=A0ABD2KSK8_9BILA